MLLQSNKAHLERLYLRYNRREWVSPDPLQYLYAYDDSGDREVAGLVAALLAYGRVQQILKSVGEVLDSLGSSPAEFLLGVRPGRLKSKFAGFKHRFATDDHLVELLGAVRDVLGRFGSLGDCFADGVDEADETVQPALVRFVGQLNKSAGGRCGHLLADPARGSACKRYHLYLRWMVRRDEVDPGGWSAVDKSKLIVPLDTHMHRIALAMGATTRASADGKTAREVTAAFRRIRPDDPVRYDFALTRSGINPAANMGDFQALFSGDQADGN